MNTPSTSSRSDISKWFPVRENQRNTNKGSFGHVTVMGGSEQYSGAPILTAHASARTGAGMVSVIFPRALVHSILSRLSPVIVTGAVGDNETSFFTESTIDETTRFCERMKTNVVALGPGIGRSKSTSIFNRTIIKRYIGPMVIDADSLTLLSGEPDQGASLIQNRSSETVLTPHPGELAQLLNTNVESIQSDRPMALQRAVEKYRCVIVLKGYETLIANSIHEVFQNPTGNPGMATAGTGDVLTGIISGLLAQGLSARESAIAGVYIHGLSADIAAAAQNGFTGLLATDIINKIPMAIAEVQSGTITLTTERTRS